MRTLKKSNANCSQIPLSSGLAAELATVRMFSPPHPGLTLRDDVLPALQLSVTKAAQQLGVSRVALSRVMNGRAAISPEMALRIEAWLGVDRGGEAGLWLAEQNAYDMWRAEERFKATPMQVQRAPVEPPAGGGLTF